jgi:hypothetical protein
MMINLPDDDLKVSAERERLGDYHVFWGCDMVPILLESYVVG